MGQTEPNSQFFFADFRRFLLIFAFPAQIFAGNRRFSQKTAETCLSHLVCPFSFLPRSALKCSQAAAATRLHITKPERGKR